MKILSIFLICIYSVCGQDTYKGLVVNEVSKQPIPFVNIGVQSKRTGTVSDEKGIFYLYLDETKIQSTDIVQFSSLGYQTIEMSVSNANIYCVSIQKLKCDLKMFF